MKTYLILILLIFQFGLGQKTPEPFQAVKTFFEVFHNRDLQGLKDSFDATAVMQRAAMRNGKSVLFPQDVSLFIERVASRPNTPVWNESLGEPKVQQSANLATVWVPFKFYLDDTLSQCGVNQFTLFWNGEQWKIIHLIDTSEKCSD
jgi:hypothetical protein